LTIAEYRSPIAKWRPETSKGNRQGEPSTGTESSVVGTKTGCLYTTGKLSAISGRRTTCQPRKEITPATGSGSHGDRDSGERARFIAGFNNRSAANPGCEIYFLSPAFMSSGQDGQPRPVIHAIPEVSHRLVDERRTNRPIRPTARMRRSAVGRPALPAQPTSSIY